MKSILKLLGAVALILALAGTGAFAQTDGGARLETTILDYNGTGTRHWTVVWVTGPSGAFIKSLRKQGPAIGDTHWNNHCPTWYAAKAGSTALDGYSSPTALNYGTTATNNPIIWTWNCRDANNNLVPDGSYKFWVQYAEENNDIEGPYTTGGLLWTKGPSAATNTYVNQGANFSGMKVVWTPSVAPTVPTTFTSVRVSGGNVVMNGTGPVNGIYAVLTSTNANAAGAQWTPIATSSISAGGSFSFTTALDPNAPRTFYRLRLP